MKDETFDAYYYKALSQIVTSLRIKNGRTFEDVSLLVDLKPMTFYKYENGSRKMPITVFKKLCLLYNVDMKDTMNKINELAIKMMEGDE